MIGKVFGQYEIVEKVGAGGMGEVYRARDTKLDRIVAIKVLPELFAVDVDRLARFEREARLLASLNHPHIATLYGLEHIDGVHFLAMEFIEGDDLAQRLARGPMAANEAAQVGAQIAEALEVAHESGVVHRDLKPANIKFASDGTVKVLDFGLAKAMDADDGNSDMTHSPTITSGGTAAGVILGTAAYMSPEQARGRAVDKRTDIWAFGCVLFEMLSGRNVFMGETVSDTIAKILERTPDWDALPGNVPPRVKRLLERCLEKDVKRRLRDIGEARIELEDAVADSKITASKAATEKRRGRHPLLWAAAGVAIGIVATFAALRFGGGDDAAVDGIIRVAIKPPENATIRGFSAPALSSDSRMLAYSAIVDNDSRLFVRNLGSYETRMLTDINASGPFFSPDGRWVGFVSREQSGARLMRVSVEGGTPLPICALSGGPGAGAWTRDGQVIIAADLTTGLVSVPAAGGAAVALTVPDSTEGELGHWSACVLPDDDHVLFTSWRTRMDDARIKVVRRSTGETRVVVENGVNPLYVEPGFLLYTLGATLMCVPFDAARARVTGDPVPVIDPVYVAITNGTTSVAAGGGTICYLPSQEYNARLVWGRLDGTVEPVVDEQRDYDGIAVSRDGGRIVLDIDEGGKSDLWVLDLERRSLTRLTVDGTNTTPIFSPDGRTVTFPSMRRGPFELYSIGAGGGSSPQRLFPSKHDLSANCWTPDGTALLFSMFNEETLGDIMQFTPATGEVRPFIQTPFFETNVDVSPDGRWVVYDVYASDKGAVYVSPFGGVDRFQVTVDGGYNPRWSRDGRALYFLETSANAVYRVEVTTDPVFRADRPVKILGKEQLGGYIETYDPHPDGQRIALVINKDLRGQRVFNVMLNVRGELERLTQ